MSVASLLAFCSITLIAAIVNGISGFAFGVVVLMAFPYIFGYTKALALAGLMGLLIACFNAYLYRKDIDWKWVPRWFSVFIAAELVSVLVLKKIGDAPMWYTLLGVLFMVLGIYLLWGQSKIRIKPTVFTMVIMSVLSGLIMGCFGVGGSVMAAFFLEATNGKEQYLGTTQLMGAIIYLVDMILRSANGMFTADLWGLTAVGVFFMVIGLFIAKKLVSHMDALTMRRFICAVMIVNGVVTLFH